MNTLLSLLAVLTFFLVGFSIIITLPLKKLSFDLKIGLSYGLGIGLISTQMLLYMFLHIPWEPLLLLIPWIFYIFLIRKKFKLKIKRIEKLSYKEVLLTVFIGTVVLFVLFESQLRIVINFDAWANWFLAGKAIYLNRSLNHSYISYANNSSPPIMYLMLSFVYIIIGSVDDRVGLLPFAFYYISLLIVFFASIRTKLPLFYALLLTLFLATLQDFVRHAGLYDIGDADIAVGYYIFSTVILFLHWRKNIYYATSIIFLLFASLSALIKEDGLPFLLVTLIISAIVIYKSKKFWYFYMFAIPIFLSGTWYTVVHIFHFPNSPFVSFDIQLARIPLIIKNFDIEFLDIKRWNLLWFVFLISLFFIKKSENLFVLLFFSLQLFTYFVVYLMTPADPQSHIANSFDRLLLQIAPLAMFFIAIIFAENLKSPKVKRTEG